MKETELSPDLDDDGKKCHHRVVEKHDKTLEAMRRMPANLRWSDVEALFKHYGATITKGSGSAITVNLKGHKGFFHRPHPEDKADRGAIGNALELLKRAGIIK